MITLSGVTRHFTSSDGGLVRALEDAARELGDLAVGRGTRHHRLLLGVDVDEDGLHLPEVLQRALELVVRHQRQDGVLVVDERLERRGDLRVGVQPVFDEVREHDPTFEHLRPQGLFVPPPVELDLV